MLIPYVAARDREAQILARCVAFTLEREAPSSPIDCREANVLRVAAMVLQSRFPMESRRLMDAAESYYRKHPASRAPVVDAIRNGDIISLPRFRDMLTQLLRRKPGIVDLSSRLRR